jgi:hypothetical protein
LVWNFYEGLQKTHLNISTIGQNHPTGSEVLDALFIKSSLAGRHHL